jgi:hypothetical protein
LPASPACCECILLVSAAWGQGRGSLTGSPPSPRARHAGLGVQHAVSRPGTYHTWQQVPGSIQGSSLQPRQWLVAVAPVLATKHSIPRQGRLVSDTRLQHGHRHCLCKQCCRAKPNVIAIAYLVPWLLFLSQRYTACQAGPLHHRLQQSTHLCTRVVRGPPIPGTCWLHLAELL